MTETVISAQQIQEIIPHRYPFLLVDKVIEIVTYQKMVAIKNVTINEPFFQGHFPGLPVMPGVLQLEAIAQACAVLAHLSLKEELENKTMMICAVNNLKWKRQVVPGDTLRIEVNFIKRKKPFFMMEGNITVEGQMCCSTSLTAAEVG
jgi:3-hydroxyacyl-[acyl-carrier-protein] dehydratase